MIHKRGTRPGTLGNVDLRKIGNGFVIAAVGAGLTWLADQALPEMQNSGAINAAMFTLFSTLINAARKFYFDTRVVGMLLGILCATGSASAQQPQPIRGIVRGVLPHVMVVGVDGVRQEIRGQRGPGTGRASGTQYAQQRLGTGRASGTHRIKPWQWSPSGQAHHAAVVRVVNPDTGDGGSGVYCRLGGKSGVLTVEHIKPRQTLRVTFADGTEQNGQATVDRYGHDLAFVFVTHPTLVPAPIALQDVRPGEQVEFATYGGPDTSFRHFVGNVTATGQRLTLATPVTHGDSGAPVFNARGEVVGIQSVGIGDAFAKSRGFNVYRSSGAVGLAPLTSFVSRCFGGQCEQQQQAPQWQQPPPAGDDIEFYPPSPQAGAPPIAQPAQQRLVPVPPTIDRDAIAKQVRDQIIADIRAGKLPELIGPKGPVGDAAVVDAQAIAAQVVQSLPPVVLSINGTEQTAPLGQAIKLQTSQRKVR
jgi:S1-C subfamily serine protease